MGANLRIQGARVGILGLTFKENVPDLRNSRVPDIISELRQFAIEPRIHDPLSNPHEAQQEYGINLVQWQGLSSLDALILAVPLRSGYSTFKLNLLEFIVKVLVTGAAGFIGFHLCQRLLTWGDEVVGLDNLNDYYDVSLKKDRLAQLKQKSSFSFHKLDLANQPGIAQLFAQNCFDVVVNLAAQAGVRYSLKNPHAYVDSNLVGFTNILEGCRYGKVKHLVFASSSSVYGANTKIPFSVHHNVDHPVSLYAATKKANELMAHTYSHLYGLPTTGLRFFTVYGPWGRPDMALFLFTKAILARQAIEVFNYGKMQRDFTYIDDIVEGVVRVIDKVPQSNPQWSGNAPDPGTSNAPYKIYNIGNNNPVELMDFIEAFEDCLGIKAEKKMLPIQPGDVPVTYADVEDLVRDVGFKPKTTIQVGIERFVKWYRDYYFI